MLTLPVCDLWISSLTVAMAECNCEISFKKAWGMLRQLPTEQDLWALKCDPFGLNSTQA